MLTKLLFCPNTKELSAGTAKTRQKVQLTGEINHQEREVFLNHSPVFKGSKLL